MELVAKLRYMGRQYANGQAARGGGQQKHYLEEAADEIEALRAKAARWDAIETLIQVADKVAAQLTTPNASFSREPERSGGESAGSVCWAPTLEIGMTPVDLIADLRSRINPAYANQIGTKSWERKLCADALEEQASAIDLLHSWEADAKARASLLEQHLRAVLEVARVWQPDYATKTDIDTLQYAQECADGKVTNAKVQARTEAHESGPE